MKKIIYLSIVMLCTCLVLTFISGIEENISFNNWINDEIKENKVVEEEMKEVSENVVFESNSIPSDILNKMIGNSIPEEYKNEVDINKLAYLKITYLGFDEKSHIGELIVNVRIADEVLDIFKEIYYSKYEIEKIKLIDEYGADDEKSMEDNNTSAFCYRKIVNTNNLSNHSKGTAIDINPLYNPYVTQSSILPVNAEEYINRSNTQKGTIQKGDAVYNAFTKRGWTWGGEWKGIKDYQHFEKNI